MAWNAFAEVSVTTAASDRASASSTSSFSYLDFSTENKLECWNAFIPKVVRDDNYVDINDQVDFYIPSLRASCEKLLLERLSDSSCSLINVAS